MAIARSAFETEQHVIDLASPRQGWQYRGLVFTWLVGQASFWSW